MLEEGRTTQSTHINRSKKLPRRRFPIPKPIQTTTRTEPWWLADGGKEPLWMTNLLNDFLADSYLGRGCEDYSKLKAENKHEGIYMASINHILCWSSCSCVVPSDAIKSKCEYHQLSPSGNLSPLVCRWWSCVASIIHFILANHLECDLGARVVVRWLLRISGIWEFFIAWLWQITSISAPWEYTDLLSYWCSFGSSPLILLPRQKVFVERRVGEMWNVFHKF